METPEKTQEIPQTKTQTEMKLQAIDKIKRSYLICFNPYATDRDEVIDALVNAGLRTWRSEFSSCIMLKTSYSANQIRELLLNVIQGRFIVAEISGNRNGMMTQKGWDFLADSKNSEVKY